MYGTFWALVPALLAIILALITKEVYSSLFFGIVMGALFFSNFSFVGTFTHIINDGLISVLSDSYNVGILIFLILLGCMVSLMNKSGGSKAFGEWASKNIKTKTGAMLATMLLGVLIFIDDYFNCLTVGSVMRPVTDKNKISREKLAYLIDATAAPVCIIAPISSWAAAVSGFIEGENGLSLFISAIPYNFYALLTLAMIIMISVMNFDFGPMKKAEDDAKSGKLHKVSTTNKEDIPIGKGTIVDLIIPIIILIILCVLGMIYSGGFFNEITYNINSPSLVFRNFIDAFANSDASVGLVIGSLFTLILTIAYYSFKRVLSFKECMNSLVDGFKNMSAAILILALAWTLKAMTDSLGAKDFVTAILGNNIEKFSILIPAIVFIIGAFISFSTGTSWGTFGILIPIVVSVFLGFDRTLMILSISACMAGAVFGDHCSPISDTTIMSSAGAECEHIKHVSTQLPYASLVAVISFICYIIAGFAKNPILPLLLGLLLLYFSLYYLNTQVNKKEPLTKMNTMKNSKTTKKNKKESATIMKTMKKTKTVKRNKK